MAKVINISPSGGGDYISLPGSEGSFDVEAEGITDTILGQTYNSAEVGLVTWKVGSDGIFKGFAGYRAKILKTVTPSIINVAAPATDTGDGFTYQIDNAAKRMIDRTQTIAVLDNAVNKDAEVESIDYLFGRIKFKSTYTVTEPVTISYFNFNTVVLGKANSYTLGMTAETIDTSDFATVQANAGTRTFIPGLRTVNLELGGIYDATLDLKTALTDREELIIEVSPSGDLLTRARGFFKAQSVGQSGSVGALEEESLSFNLFVPDETVNAPITYPFQWDVDVTSTLNGAIIHAIDSWIGESADYLVQYLPTGVTGNSDGVFGSVIFTDISLSGGLSNMNVFNIEMTGTDQFTIT